MQNVYFNFIMFGINFVLKILTFKLSHLTQKLEYRGIHYQILGMLSNAFAE